MSTILKALRRLEEEKAQPGRPLREEVVVSGSRGPSVPLRWVAAAGFVLVAGALLLWWSPLQRGSGEPVRQVAETPAAAQPATPPARTRAPRTATASPAPAARPPLAAERRTVAIPTPPATAAAPKPTPAPPPRVATPRAPAAPAPPPTAAAPEPQPPPAPRAAPPPPAAPAAAVLPPVPSPRIVIARTLWHPDPGKRVAEVEIEGREGTLRLREGDAVGPLVVREIEPSGVLFVQGSVELLHRVGAKR